MSRNMKRVGGYFNLFNTSILKTGMLKEGKTEGRSSPCHRSCSHYAIPTKKLHYQTTLIAPRYSSDKVETC